MLPFLFYINHLPPTCKELSTRSAVCRQNFTLADRLFTVAYGKLCLHQCKQVQAFAGKGEHPQEEEMKPNRTKIIVAALAVLLVAAVAVSQTVRKARMADHEFPFGGHMLGFFADYLDLTDAQQDQIKQILAKEKPAIQPLLEQMSQSRHELRQLSQSGSFDEAKVRALATQQSAAMTELIVQKARIHSELFQVLTPEQKAKMVKFMDRKEQRFHKWMHPAPPDS